MQKGPTQDWKTAVFQETCSSLLLQYYELTYSGHFVIQKIFQKNALLFSQIKLVFLSFPSCTCIYFPLKVVVQFLCLPVKESFFKKKRKLNKKREIILKDTLCQTSVVLTDQKRTPQILRARTLKVLRQS